MSKKDAAYIGFILVMLVALCGDSLHVRSKINDLYARSQILEDAIGLQAAQDIADLGIPVYTEAGQLKPKTDGVFAGEQRLSILEDDTKDLRKSLSGLQRRVLKLEEAADVEYVKPDDPGLHMPRVDVHTSAQTDGAGKEVELPPPSDDEPVTINLSMMMLQSDHVDMTVKPDKLPFIDSPYSILFGEEGSRQMRWVLWGIKVENKNWTKAMHLIAETIKANLDEHVMVNHVHQSYPKIDTFIGDVWFHPKKAGGHNDSDLSKGFSMSQKLVDEKLATWDTEHWKQPAE